MQRIVRRRLRVAEASRAAGVSVESVRKWLKSGRLAGGRDADSGLLLVDAESLARLVAERAARRGLWA